MAATRKDVRKRLATLGRETGAFDEVFDHAPLDLRGKDKTLAIYSDRSRHQRESKHLKTDLYYLFLETYAYRRLDPAAAEDNIDEMHEAIRKMIDENVGDGAWDEIFLDEDSDLLFAQVAKEPYRVERHVVWLKVQQ